MSEFDAGDELAGPALPEAGAPEPQPAWPGPSPEEWQAVQEQLAGYEAQQQFAEFEAAADEQAVTMSVPQERVAAGDPEAVVEMQQLFAAGGRCAAGAVARVAAGV